ncbi:MAG: hypothetical protein CVV36_01055 [Candidatus Methanoperedenaceae archaeon HGW-Methanoperedenaceae-1]|jgi:methylated-DNA-[protein]-cysteine S-methyltransferase|nr:MAG: hypothetical protein CVV36_01055 [Candidatus Methanoperedenaceae archaeon HGW-Methanoperedenaceae-1]
MDLSGYVSICRWNMAVDVIFAEPLGCYVEVVYGGGGRLSYIRFLRSGKQLPERKTLPASFELEQYFEGERTGFSCGCDISGLSQFTLKVLGETQKVRFGETVTYSQLARNIGTKAYRAVGRALSCNPIPIVIPCHRVVAKNGIGGYSEGVDIKERLLELEKKYAVNNI